VRKRLKKLESLIEIIRNQHNDLSVDNSYNFLRAAEIFNNYLNVGFRKTGLKRTQIIILSFLLANGGTMTPTELKSKIFRSINATSKSLDSLDKLGLTKSSKSKRDRRQRRVTLTEKGVELLEGILIVRRELFAQATSCLNQDDSEALRSILSQLENHLLGIMGKAPVPKEQKFYF